MERDDQNHSSQSLLSPNTKQFTHSLRKIPPPNNNNNSNDRLKRDEWSEGAVSTLLEAYEEKWILRNRAKLKGQDWEEVAKQVSGRSNNTKSGKTQTQCKNKIESMKKRYRSESASPDTSSWPIYPRLDLLLRGNGPVVAAAPPPAVMVEPSLPLPASLLASHGLDLEGVDRVDKVDDQNDVRAKSMDQEPEKNNQINDNDNDSSSTPALYTGKDHENKIKPRQYEIRDEKKKQKKKNKRKIGEEHWGIGKSIRWVAEVVARCEETRMETMKEIERMRTEAETKRGEMDLKRTEIIANTQLEIAKLFANTGGGSIDSSNLRIGRS